MKVKSAFYAGIAAITMLLVPAQAQAQGKAAQADTANEPASDSGDIVVTAQRRSERLSNVPASITAISGDLISSANITASADLAKVTPGLTMQFYGGFLQPAIRGVTSGGANVGEASNVATYIDGVYQPQQIATLVELPDIERIEVLKGPQGALYGQNATGGAILINSLAPSFTTTGKFSASYGNFNAVNLRGYVSGPVSDTVAVSLAGGYHNRDGFRRQVLTGQRDFGLDSKSVRGKILFKPAQSASFTLTGYYSDRRDSAAYAGFALNGNSTGYALAPAMPRATNTNQFEADPGVFTRIRSWGVNLRSEFELGGGTLTNVTAYFHNKANYLADPDYSPLQFTEAYTPSMTGHYILTDTNFASDSTRPVSYLLGIFYMDGSETFDVNGFRILSGNLPPAPKVPTFVLNTFQKLAKSDIAFYGEVTVRPVEGLSLTAGGRYTEERQRGYSDFAGPTVLEYPGDPVKFRQFTPRVTAKFELSPRTNVYASWGKGFKSGGINLSDYTKLPFRPETISAFEVGFKGRLADGLRLNLAAFHYDYKNLQLVQFAPPVYFEENAAEARINGVDFDINWDVAPGLNLTMGGTALDAKYRNAIATIFVPNGAGNDAVPGTNISGKRLIRAPKFTGNIGVRYETETGAGKVGFYGGLYYNSGYAFEASGRIGQSSYATADAELSFEPSGMPGLRVSIWGKNLTDKAYLASLLQSNFADGASYAEPRTFGVRGEFSF